MGCCKSNPDVLKITFLALVTDGVEHFQFCKSHHCGSEDPEKPLNTQEEMDGIYK